MKLDNILKSSQKKLYNLLCGLYNGLTVSLKNSFILVRGEIPVLLVAHLDTVHRQPVKTICASANGKILMSPQGIGGDDRCGVYALTRIYETSQKKPWLLFTCDEEIGGLGAQDFCDQHRLGQLPKELNTLKLIVEIDRRGKQDAVYYECNNKDFETYINSKGFKTADGTFSDISIIAPTLGVAAVNLSSGYYNAHTLHEYINIRHLECVIEKVKQIVQDVSLDKIKRFPYVRKVLSFAKKYDAWKYLDEGEWAYDDAYESAMTVPEEYKEMYDELQLCFGAGTLDNLREQFGDEVIRELYDRINHDGGSI